MEIFYPIHIDRWTNPIASLLREISTRNPQFDSFSFSGPQTEEDKQLGNSYWNKDHIHRLHYYSPLFKTFDIVHHASATTSNLGASLMATLRSFKNCTHVFTANIEPYQEDLYYKHYKFSVSLADKVVAVSKAVARGVRKRFDRSIDTIIPNGVDVDFFSPSEAERSTLSRFDLQKNFVLFAGRLTDRKRPDTFIQIADYFPDHEFVMVGPHRTEKERQKYLRMIERTSNVQYLGLVPRSVLRDLMAYSQALVFPSEKEGLPLTVCEAGAMGLPTLARPRSSLPEVVKEDVTGWLIDGEEPDGWIEKLNEVTGWSPSQRKRFSRKARSFVEERFSWDGIARQYRDFYADIV